MRLLIWAVWAAEPEDVSLLHVLFYIRSAGSFEVLVDTEDGAQEDRVIGGTQLISLRMAEQLGDRIRLSAAGPPDRAWPRRRHRPRRRRNGPRSPRDRRDPADPDRRGSPTTRRCPRSATGSPSGWRRAASIKCMAIYPEPFWRAEGLSGATTSADGPVSVTFDNSPPDGSPGVLLAFLEGRAARSPLRCRGGAPGSGDRLPAAILRRARREARSATSTGPGRTRSSREVLRRVHATRRLDRERAARCGRRSADPLGGAETAVVWNGYMDGAVRSGEAAAAMPPRDRRRRGRGARRSDGRQLATELGGRGRDRRSERRCRRRRTADRGPCLRSACLRPGHRSACLGRGRRR